MITVIDEHKETVSLLLTELERLRKAIKALPDPAGSRKRLHMLSVYSLAYMSLVEAKRNIRETAPRKMYEVVWRTLDDLPQSRRQYHPQYPYRPEQIPPDVWSEGFPNYTL